MKKLKNNLDERQEQDLLHIESTSFWLLFCGLLAAIFIEWLMGFDTKAMAGEWILFFAASISMAVRCLRKGIWDRHLKPNLRTNLMISATAAVVFGAFVAVRTGSRFPDRPVGVVASAVFSAGMVFVLCFGMLSAAARSLKKRQKQLEEETEEIGCDRHSV